MKYTINLTPFQRTALENLMIARQESQKSEREFVEMIFSSNGKVAPSDGIGVNNGVLSWEAPNKTEFTPVNGHEPVYIEGEAV
jgi:hypothetical protein